MQFLASSILLVLVLETMNCSLYFGVAAKPGIAKDLIEPDDIGRKAVADFIVKRYIRVGYNLDIMRQSACLVLNPITVYSYGFLFNCTTVGQASDSMTALT